MQQSLAEYKFGQNTKFIYRKVPGVSEKRITTIHKNVLTCLHEMWLVTHTGFLHL